MTIPKATPRDHQAEHVGCLATFPWEEKCERYSNLKALLEMAQSDVSTALEEDQHFVNTICAYQREDAEGTNPFDARNRYIAEVEGYREDAIKVWQDQTNRRVAVVTSRFTSRDVSEDILLRRRWTKAIHLLLAHHVDVCAVQAPEANEDPQW